MDIKLTILGAIYRLPNTSIETILLIEKNIKYPIWEIKNCIHGLKEEGFVIETIESEFLPNVYHLTLEGKRYFFQQARIDFKEPKPLNIHETKTLLHAKKIEAKSEKHQYHVLKKMSEHPRFFPSTLMIEDWINESPLDTMTIIASLAAKQYIQPENNHDLWSIQRKL